MLPVPPSMGFCLVTWFRNFTGLVIYIDIIKYISYTSGVGSVASPVFVAEVDYPPMGGDGGISEEEAMVKMLDVRVQNRSWLKLARYHTWLWINTY